MFKKFINDKNKLRKLLIVEFLSYFILELTFAGAFGNYLGWIFKALFFITYSLMDTNVVCGSNDIKFSTFLKCALRFAIICVGITVANNFIFSGNFLRGGLIIFVTCFVWVIFDVMVVEPEKVKNGVIDDKK